MSLNKTHTKPMPNDGRKTFIKMGTCSRTFFYLLNREFGHNKEIEERASDALAGGIMQKGYQCGMLWGASLATGAEVYRKYPEDINKAIGITVKATQNLMSSFVNRTKTTSCKEITNCDFTSKLSMTKYMLSGKFLGCFNLAQKWAPEAVASVSESLSKQPEGLNESISCASEVLKKMGATDEEIVSVAGFAGGLGLSGSGCGALAAAIWHNTKKWNKENPKKMALKNEYAQNTMDLFVKETGGEITCDKICGRKFETLQEHTEFIKNGGCSKLIQTLAKTKNSDLN